ncbi:glycoside hydrolase family 9 protein [Pedobacter sp. SG908]|uniref:glycoside hydrolase family 9 protein n=1 Tax=Pedobacter sp. SG908 TaxID=2587135 RepID=UPI00141EE425|nr:glycoside hydrolase family 9 protein [Pedobacter sp. SG908]NII84401.1 peptidoglycan/xylan/chitin deacetylase (PgdA/CDA1 family) [Pedobacter sp. SG908]
MKNKFFTVATFALALWLLCSFIGTTRRDHQRWIRINLLGYPTESIKVAVWASKTNEILAQFEIVEKETNKIVYTSTNIKSFGRYGPFKQTARLNFSDFKKQGSFYIRANGTTSPLLLINDDVYKGAADFCLQYMRQQRSGFNPYLKDSCHTHDGFVLYGAKAGLKDSTHFDASGGWHDASDYLQYSTTSANATYHLLMAYRDFPQVFGDKQQANGLTGKNGRADILDEAKWGLDWLLKMHPQKNMMFNQLADDRDHISMRIPKEDSQYGKGFERPLYFITGEPQQRGKFMNNTTGTSSTAAKFTSAFNLGSVLFKERDRTYAQMLTKKAKTAYKFALRKPGVTQTASVKSPYIYAEDNWVDDMELAETSFNFGREKVDQKKITLALNYAQQESVTPWLQKDTAAHYQYYPFINLGHYEIARQDLKDKTAISYYQKGIKQVWNRAQNNAFYRGIPFIWCSNNLTVSFAMQCNWYAALSGDKTYAELEQANFDWLFGSNPWGTSMVYGLPQWGDTPTDPHSAFTHLKNYPINGGLVDGPVYTNIYKGLIGIKLNDADEYADFQSDLAVYHDDYGDYSTNEPTMDGTASLIYLLAAKEAQAKPLPNHKTYSLGANIRGDSTQKKIYLVFTGDEYADGGEKISKVLAQEKVKASFFLTGNFYRNPNFHSLIKKLKNDGHYLGPHSDKHLLYCDWNKRDSLLVTKTDFEKDLNNNYQAMAGFGINKETASYFLPPYEWYNQTIANWTNALGLQLINFTPGTRSNADYTYPEMGKSYRSSDEIYRSIITFNETKPSGLNGFILLLHIGTDARRTDKFYNRLAELITYLKKADYKLARIDN